MRATSIKIICVPSVDSDQHLHTTLSCKLIITLDKSVFAGFPWHFVGFVIQQLFIVKSQCLVINLRIF